MALTGTEKTRRWLEKNPGYQKEYNKRRRKTDPAFLLQNRLRARMADALRRRATEKSIKTMKLIGCSVSDLMIHLESKFQEGMSWENRDQWHVDHILPCSSFDLTDPEQQKKCFHYSNLQPLWKLENLRKANKILTEN